MNNVKNLESKIMMVGGEVKSQAVNGVVAGFSFAAAVAWMDLARWMLSNLVNVKANGGMYYTLTALVTTLLSVLVVMVLNMTVGGVKKPTTPMYAVTRA